MNMNLQHYALNAYPQSKVKKHSWLGRGYYLIVDIQHPKCMITFTIYSMHNIFSSHNAEMYTYPHVEGVAQSKVNEM